MTNENVWARFGDVANYVEPFCGSVAVLLARTDKQWQDGRTETVNDLSGYIANFWRADELRKIPATVRFISYEPALGPIDHAINLSGIHWLIYGGESGPKFRHNHYEWCANIQSLCRANGTAFFFKQFSGYKPGLGRMANGTTPREFPV